MKTSKHKRSNRKHVKHTKKRKYDHTHNVLNNEMKTMRKLRSLCPDTSKCILHHKQVKEFMGDFKDFSYIDTDNIKVLSTSSVNGMICVLPFKKHSLVSHVVLKCANEKSSDSLYYEYYVGKSYINKYIDQFPLLLETYDIYEFNDRKTHDMFSLQVKLNAYFTSLADMLKPVPHNSDFWKRSCKYNKRGCIFIQHVANFMPLSDIDQHPDLFPLIPIYMYQVYFVLCYLGKNYTHYDLHAGNVGLYTPVKDDEYFMMRYHSKGKIVEFPTQHLCKMIDLGRNYFNNGETNTSAIVDYLCTLSACGNNCGENLGYAFLQKPQHLKMQSKMQSNINVLSIGGSKHVNTTSIQNDGTDYITPYVSNMSADLLLANRIDKALPGILDYFGEIQYQYTYGVPEKLVGDKPYHITSIFHLLNEFDLKMEEYVNRYVVNLFNGYKCKFVIDVYDDGRPYVITPLKHRK